ncbi:hypothetical protein PR202_ga14289 [Eleusine coracana subsp. coracana]|uniref:Uncharacterized protein n=1 Tax=Eleusine coracana subsp. coracana TaxID=191504 RepID=A0AAV5CH63_ELECO|nr:hypothetical protein PR202_ga14289 [Eleusine coracana subsp. coracana]
MTRPSGAWFRMSKSDSEDVELAESRAGQASQVLKERLRTLNEAARMMSRADVLKNERMNRNRHPDYEFFLFREVIDKVPGLSILPS